MNMFYGMAYKENHSRKKLRLEKSNLRETVIAKFLFLFVISICEITSLLNVTYFRHETYFKPYLYWCQQMIISAMKSYLTHTVDSFHLKQLVQTSCKFEINSFFSSIIMLLIKYRRYLHTTKIKNYRFPSVNQ